MESIYFDNSSTVLKNSKLVEKVNTYLTGIPTSYNRGNNSINITKQVENIRKKVKDFINADSDNQIIFTTGATMASNLIAYSYGLYNLKKNDEILLCEQDHKSTVLPFYNLKNILERFNTNIKIENILIHPHGDYEEQDLLSKVTSNTKIIILTHIHNMYGLEMNIIELVENIKKINKNCKIVLDASQSIGHIKVDVKQLDIDMLYFSGHKMGSLPGVGILYIKDKISEFTPFIIGGGFSNKELTIKKNKDLENGTLNIPAIISLESAIDKINELGIDYIENTIYSLTRYLYDKLQLVPNLEFNKGIAKCKCALGYGIISFKINGITSNELGEILRDYNIFVRTGDFCNMSNHDDYIRVSLYYYNTKEEIDKFIKVLTYLVDNV